MINDGLKNEKDIIKYINEMRYTYRMNSNIQKFLNEIFDFDISTTEIKAYNYAENYKPDMIITAKGVSKYISIKSGESNSVHQEHVHSFISFLEENGFSGEERYNLLLFHFNDGTTNGSGLIRKSAAEFLEQKQHEIQKINEKINNEYILSKAITRILFKGECYNIPTVDYIYYGTIDKGLWASKEEIIKFMNNAKIFTSSIHISKLYYQSLHRNLKHDKYREHRRYYVQFKWYSIKEDLQYIMSRKKV